MTTYALRWATAAATTATAADAQGGSSPSQLAAAGDPAPGVCGARIRCSRQAGAVQQELHTAAGHA
jgi:hypothetical protein